MYIVIVGAGDIGRPLIEIAVADGNEVVVVEHDDRRADRIASDHDCLVINADATVKDTLEDAGATHADAIISTTDQDATNIMVCLLSKELEVENIVSVVHNPEHMSVFRQIGVHTIENPQRLIAEYLYRSVRRPSIIDYMRVGEQAAVFEISVDDDAPVAGTTLNEAASEGLITDDILIVAVEREGEDDSLPITPRGSTTIEPGDVLTVYSAKGATPDVTDLFGHFEDQDGLVSDQNG
jgi:trk system potassium uptake protein TrkA